MRRISAAEFARWQVFLDLYPPAAERIDYAAWDLANFLGSRLSIGEFTPQPTRFREWEKDPEQVAAEAEEREQAAFAAGMAGMGG